MKSYLAESECGLALMIKNCISSVMDADGDEEQNRLVMEQLELLRVRKLVFRSNNTHFNGGFHAE